MISMSSESTFTQYPLAGEMSVRLPTHPRVGFNEAASPSPIMLFAFDSKLSSMILTSRFSGRTFRP